MSILDWVYAHPGTLEALIERHWAPDDIFAMTTEEAVERATLPTYEEARTFPTLPLAQVTYEAAMRVKANVSSMTEQTRTRMLRPERG